MEWEAIFSALSQQLKQHPFLLISNRLPILIFLPMTILLSSWLAPEQGSLLTVLLSKKGLLEALRAKIGSSLVSAIALPIICMRKTSRGGMQKKRSI